MDLQKVPCVSANTIYIEWPKQSGLFNNYIVKYRAKESKGTFAMERTSENKIQISNLKNGTLYEIKIYVENTYGDESLSFKTEVRTVVVSIASKLIKEAVKICDEPAVYRLCPVEIRKPSKGIQIHEFCKL